MPGKFIEISRQGDQEAAENNAALLRFTALPKLRQLKSKHNFLARRLLIIFLIIRRSRSQFATLNMQRIDYLVALLRSQFAISKIKKLMAPPDVKTGKIGFIQDK